MYATRTLPESGTAPYNDHSTHWAMVTYMDTDMDFAGTVRYAMLYKSRDAVRCKAQPVDSCKQAALRKTDFPDSRAGALCERLCRVPAPRAVV